MLMLPTRPHASAQPHPLLAPVRGSRRVAIPPTASRKQLHRRLVRFRPSAAVSFTIARDRASRPQQPATSEPAWQDDAGRRRNDVHARIPVHGPSEHHHGTARRPSISTCLPISV
ncbi:uncharacterized protein K452DRAFT_309863 [Aplosporella prunicola CBS 121167]|uniref:Uncharacterized protein n=1 Tax=Aplosporella prunicola CBS 121167 TaxID=1176127 RepID=A0A6A6B916_9PEZI|nr:uncharacterized protein K452DRAFT_309863 [Aplosporella prunicola CBS 121167]KAF2140762.1 hypothetical protein K452DRAFT_309863 [Aplosporella prunicola CBS 121167]